MKTQRKTMTSLENELLMVFSEIYSESEAVKAVKDAKKVFKMLRQDDFFNDSISY